MGSAATRRQGTIATTAAIDSRLTAAAKRRGENGLTWVIFKSSLQIAIGPQHAGYGQAALRFARRTGHELHEQTAVVGWLGNLALDQQFVAGRFLRSDQRRIISQTKG